MIAVAPLVRALVLGHTRGVATGALAAAFHRGLAARLVAAVALLARAQQLDTVVLTGGCFQNRLLLDAICDRLVAAGLVPLLHRRLPPGDGGLAVGQLAVAIARAAGADPP